MICFALFIIFKPLTTYADIGPKPSIVIDFEGYENEAYYVTLLSEIPSTGPHSALGEKPNIQRYQRDDEDYEIWNKFVSYRDKDGFYFLQYFSDCTETSQFTWGYYPPPKFKILMYFPVYDSFVISEDVYERYAFDSYFRVDGNGFEILSVTNNVSIVAERNYDYSWQLISLFVRIFATIVIEIFIAILFGFRSKKQIIMISIANIFTQTLLNILLNITDYNYGSLMFIFNFVWMEALVFIIEAVLYYTFLPKYNSKDLRKRWVAPLYALIANAVSFGVGICIAYFIPGIF
jgi:hypothetical protein